MKKRKIIITTVIVFAILLSTMLSFASCSEKITDDNLPTAYVVSRREYHFMSGLPSYILGTSYISLINHSDNYTLRFESDDAWELHAITPIADKEAGDIVNGCVLDITERTCMLRITKSSYEEHHTSYICLSLMRGNKCVAYRIFENRISLFGAHLDGTIDEPFFNTNICKSEVFDKPQPYSEVQKIFAEYKAA